MMLRRTIEKTASHLAGLVLVAIVLAGCRSPESNTSMIEPNTEVLFMEEGGWCWYQDPRAVINRGQLIIGGINGQNGDVRIGVYLLDSERSLGTLVVDEAFERDDHDAPAFYVRPDGSVLAMWAKHGNEKAHHYRISSPDNYLEWGEPQQFRHIYDEEWGVTYMNLYFDKNAETLYNFFRDGPNFNPSFITSTDDGETWGNRTHFIADEFQGRHRPYARYLQRDPSTIGVSFTEGHPRNYGNSLYYVDFHDNSFYTVDGTWIKDLADGPLVPSEAEKVYTGSGTMSKLEGFESVPNSAWTVAMARDRSRNPHLGYSVYLSNDDHRYRIASWNGSRWIDREIAYAGGCLYPRESSYTGLMCFDPEDPRIVYISTDVDPSTGENNGGVHEIYRATIGPDDDVTTIHWEAVTRGSTQRNIRPIVVAGEGFKAVLWLRGTYTKYVDYDCDVVGHILKAGM